MELFVVAHSQVDRPHAAVSQQSHEAIDADPPSLHVARLARGVVAEIGDGRQRLHEQRRIRHVVFEQGIHFAAQRVVTVAGLIQEPDPLVGRQLRGFQEQAFDLAPSFRRHLVGFDTIVTAA